ncbi:hypothetical protein SY88_20000 [Clostridiales bacterium PH28_bin88]|nr:hypothetical protein SY88_20000 [Clostridiales bacterium PH28_bin88]
MFLPVMPVAQENRCLPRKIKGNLHLLRRSKLLICSIVLRNIIVTTRRYKCICLLNKQVFKDYSRIIFMVKSLFTEKSGELF